jgi:hypothetical protein
MLVCIFYSCLQFPVLLIKSYPLPQFRCCEEANVATLLENLIYEGSKLTILKQGLRDKGCGELISFSKAVSHSLHNHILCCFSLFCYLDQLPDSTVSLESDEGTKIFLKLLMKVKHLFPKCGTHDAGFERLQKELVKKGVLSAVSALHTKRGNLQKQYRRHLKKENHRYQYLIPCKVIFDGASLELARGTEFECAETSDDSENETINDTSNTELLAKFCKGKYRPSSVYCFIFF